MKTERENYIDVVRGIGIVLMILGHIPLSAQFDHFIHAFHMPMFFLISGFFFHKSSSWADAVSSIKKKARKLLIPYVVFGAVYYFIWCVFVRNENPLLPLKSVVFSNTDNHMPIGGALWFLTCMFLADTGYRLICMIATRKVRFALAGVIGISGCYLSRLGYSIPWGGVPAIVAIGFYGMGDFAREYWNHIKQNAKRLNGVVLPIIFLALCGLIMKNGYINMRIGSYGIVPLFWFNAIAFTLFMTLIMEHLCSMVNRSKTQIVRLLRDILNYLMFTGKESLYFLCLNQLFLWFFRNIVPDIFAKNAIMFFMTMTCITLFVLVKHKYVINR